LVRLDLWIIFACCSGRNDIRARVEQGQLLAEIDTPEIDQQLGKARADLKTAQANEQLAQITATCWQNLLKTNSVSKQETDKGLPCGLI
jgi:multidrug resistance efflux pump